MGEKMSGMNKRRFESILVLNVDAKQGSDGFVQDCKLAWSADKKVDVCLEISNQPPYDDVVIGQAELFVDISEGPDGFARRQVRAHIEIFTNHVIEDLAPSVEGVTFEREPGLNGRILNAELRRIRMAVKNADPRIGSLADQIFVRDERFEQQYLCQAPAPKVCGSREHVRGLYESVCGGHISVEEAKDQLPVAISVERAFGEIMADDAVRDFAEDVKDLFPGVDEDLVHTALEPTLGKVHQLMAEAYRSALGAVDLFKLNEANSKAILTAFQIPSKLFKSMEVKDVKVKDGVVEGTAVLELNPPVVPFYSRVIRHSADANGVFHKKDLDDVFKSCGVHDDVVRARAATPVAPCYEITKALVKALEAGGYNAAPSELVQGCGTQISDADLGIHKTMDEIAARIQEHTHNPYEPPKMVIIDSMTALKGSTPVSTCGATVKFVDDDVCRCTMANLLSTGHDAGCPEKKR